MYVHALYESIPREMLPMLLLGRELHSRNVNYDLEQLKLASNRFGKHEDPTLRIVPFCYRDSNLKHSLSKARWKNEAALNMCWEQFCPSWFRKQSLPHGKIVESGMTFVAWGEFYASLLEKNGIKRDHIKVAGNIRLDLSKHKDLLFSREFLSKTYGLDDSKPWILIAWNLNLGNQTGPDYVSQMCKKHDLPYPQEFYDTKVKTRAAHIVYCEKIAQEFPNHEIILRTHPSGNDAKEIREKVTSKHTNLHAISNLDITNWIVESEQVVSWSSTSMIEAIAAGIPTLSYEPFPYFEKFGYQVGSIVPLATTCEEALEKMHAPEKLKDEIKWDNYRTWYGEPDGKASVRIADFCIEILKDTEKYKIPSELTRKSSILKNKGRRLIQEHPNLYPFLGWFAHGMRKRMNAKKWVPLPNLKQVIEGQSIESLYKWLSF